MSSMLPQAGRLAKPVQVDSTRRTVQVIKQHDEYRRRYFQDLRDAINGTDYLVGIADDSSAQTYYNQTARHKIVKLEPMELPTDPDEIEELKYRNPISPRIPSYRKKMSRASRLRKTELSIQLAEEEAIHEAENEEENVHEEENVNEPEKHEEDLNEEQNQEETHESEEHLNQEQNHEETDESEERLNQEQNQEETHESEEHLNQEEAANHEPGLSEQAELRNDQDDLNGDRNQEENLNEREENAEAQQILDENETTELDPQTIEGDKSNEENYDTTAETEANASTHPTTNTNSQLQDLDLGKADGKVQFAPLSPRSMMSRARSQDDGLTIAKYTFIDARANEPYRTKWDIIGASDDDRGDDRPSNCGLGPKGGAELVLQISASDLGQGDLADVSEDVYNNIRMKGFSWILVTDLNPDVNLEALAKGVKASGLKLMIDYSGSENVDVVDAVRCGPQDISLRETHPKLILIGRSEGNGFDYMYDSRPASFLMNGEFHAFGEFVRGVDEDQRRRFLHYSVRHGFDQHERAAFTASAALLLLPGMRVFANDHMDMCEIIAAVAKKKAIRRGVFSNIDVAISYGMMTAWKYTRGSQHILVCVNFGDKHGIGNIKCEDAPDPETEDGKITVRELISDTIYTRDVSELRTTGLTVILYEYQIQVFEY